MIRGKKILAIIPARSGSKGLRDKNIRQLAGKPLLQWTIESAIQSGCCDEIMVSTDSDTYAEIARSCGASVPWLRPQNLSSDDASSNDLIQHVLDSYAKEGALFDVFVLLQPTSPLRNASDILNAITLLLDIEANSVVSVCETDHSPLWSNTLPQDGSMEHFIRDEVIGKRRQELPVFYRLNGAIYVLNVVFFQTKNTFLGSGSYAYVMPAERSVDIDTLIDFQLAEVILNSVSKNE